MGDVASTTPCGHESHRPTLATSVLDEPSTLLITALFVGLFVTGKVFSTGIYQASWRNSIGRDLSRFGPLVWAATRYRLWPIHVFLVVVCASLDWNQIPKLHQPACVAVGMMVLGAVFRFGAADQRNFFFIDRLVVLTLGAGVYFSPAFLYPAIFSSACLQYTVANWALGPGYSNLLGFEFVRSTACCILGCTVFIGICECIPQFVLPLEPSNMGSLLLSVVIAFQGSYYVNHALAKCWLGPKWYSWIGCNRLECLFVNSYLRGWAAWVGQSRWLQFASWIRRARIPLGASMWTLEFAFIAIMIDDRYAAILFLAAAAFHVGVFVMTGLAEIEHVINHVSMATLLVTLESIALPHHGWICTVSIVVMLLCFVFVGLLRQRMLQQYQQSGKSRLTEIADPYDHLMAWWDSPYMRMFSYTVLAEDGTRWSLPVTKFSPYDTALTDIHTHMMLLNQHEGFDPELERDKRQYRSGVWGLLITTQERDELYERMDTQTSDHDRLRLANPEPAWCYRTEEDTPAVADSLQTLMSCWNLYLKHRWFRWIMRCPHFPGEDLAPDLSPLRPDSFPRFRFDRPIAALRIERIKTFYTGREIQLLDCSVVGTIEVIPKFLDRDANG